MASAWRDACLGDVVTLKRGYDLPARSRTPGPYPIVSSSGYTGSHCEAKVQPPGVVTGRYGTLGAVYFVEEPFWPLNTTLYAEDFKGNDPRFVAYLLEHMKLDELVASAAVPGINRNHLHPLRVRVPDLETQRRVASAISCFDLLIENNRRRVGLLERAARRLYREWFVDLKFPGLSAIQGTDRASGVLPDGWEWQTLGEAASWLSGGTPKTTEMTYWNGDIPWITSGSLTSFLLDDSERKLTPSGVAAGSRIVSRDTLLFVVRGMSLATEFRHGLADVDLAFGQDCKALVASDGIDPLVLAFAVADRASEIQQMVEFAAHGTGKLSTDRIKALRIVIPAASAQDRFTGVVRPARELMSALTRQARTLTHARDLLLPRVVSGQVEVSELSLDLEPSG